MPSTIKVVDHITLGFPPEIGAEFAKAILAMPNLDWNDLTIDCEGCLAAMLISSFCNTFLQTVHDNQPDKLDACRRIKWKTYFSFQHEHLTEWSQQFKPHPAGN